MTGNELTLIREASFSSPELSSNMQGCSNGRLYQDFIHHVPISSTWAIEASVTVPPMPRGSLPRVGTAQLCSGSLRWALHRVEVEHVKD